MAKKKKRSRERRRPLLFGITFRLILFVAATSLLLSYLSVYINPEKFSLPLFFGLYFIPILGINILLCLIAIVFKSKSAWIPIVILLPGFLYAERFYKIGSNNTIESEGIKLSLETYNVGMFQSSKKEMSRSETLNKIEGQIRKNSPDIVCLQEVFLENEKQVERIFPEYSYRTYHLYPIRNGKFFGNVILSKHEIFSEGVLDFPKSTNLSIYSDIVFFGDTIRVYNNHLESYNISFTSLIQKLSKDQKENAEMLTNDIIDVHAKVKGTMIRRSKQVNTIFGSISESPYNTIVCGDFNDTPMSYTYYKLSHDKKDTFRDSGKGFSATYSHLWPLLRIDYVFIPKGYECVSHKTIRQTYSDHYPVLTEFILQ
ncbi:MAG: endonuclease/exonuclease/phosphatase family protein [Candidatus Egerieousia sp.]